MKGLLPALAVASALLAGASVASATTPAIGSTPNATIGQMLASGEITSAAVMQLIQHSGLTYDEAKGSTIDQVVAKRWQNS